MAFQMHIQQQQQQVQLARLQELQGHQQQEQQQHFTMPGMPSSSVTNHGPLMQSSESPAVSLLEGGQIYQPPIPSNSISRPQPPQVPHHQSQQQQQQQQYQRRGQSRQLVNTRGGALTSKGGSISRNSVSPRLRSSPSMPGGTSSPFLDAEMSHLIRGIEGIAASPVPGVGSTSAVFSPTNITSSRSGNGSRQGVHSSSVNSGSFSRSVFRAVHSQSPNLNSTVTISASSSSSIGEDAGRSSFNGVSPSRGISTEASITQLGSPELQRDIESSSPDLRALESPSIEQKIDNNNDDDDDDDDDDNDEMMR
jgi:hypothetical protein